MSIYRKKILKAASGTDMSAATVVANKEAERKEGLDDSQDKVIGGAQNIPLWGAIAKVNVDLANDVRGKDNNVWSGGAAGALDPASGILNSIDSGASTWDTIVSGINPIGGGMQQAKDREKKEAEYKKKLYAAESLDNEKRSNAQYGQLSYEKGGEFSPDLDTSSDSDDKAVLLGGKGHDEGGNDVVDSNTGEKVAETESHELLFTKNQTDNIEMYVEKYDKTKDVECLLKLGSMIKEIVENGMIDNSKN